MPYTLGGAAKATGKSKAAISESIAKGRISANKDPLGRYQIDPAELHRVYPPLPKPNTKTEQELTSEHIAKISELTMKVELLERLYRQIEGERDNLRDQNTRLTALLSAPKPEPVPEEPKPVIETKQEPLGFWQTLWQWVRNS